MGKLFAKIRPHSYDKGGIVLENPQTEIYINARAL
jgi:hypothetical protein